MAFAISELDHGKVAYLFPGQGSQKVGMGLDFYQRSVAARQVFEQVDEALGRPLSRLMFEGPEGELQKTVNSQAAIFATSLASMAVATEEWGDGFKAQPVFVAGHSLGEYTALVAARVVELDEAVRLVHERGRLMQEACDQKPGAMAAILGLGEGVVEQVCRETGTQIANVNSSEQIVISGEKANVCEAMKLATVRGARRAVLLPVDGAFHSYLMGPAVEGMMKTLKGVQLRHPTPPVVANCTARPLNTAEDVKVELLQQVCGRVRWQDSVEYMVGAGVTSFVEFGPGRVLSGLVKRIAPQAKVASVHDVPALEKLLSDR